MDLAALYHRPESEFAYLYTEDTVHIRLRTKKDDVVKVDLLAGDTYLHYSEAWYQTGQAMAKVATSDIHDYWQCEWQLAPNRLAYAFRVQGNNGDQVFYCDRGVYPIDDQEILKQVNAYFRLPYFHESDRVKKPTWVKDTVWYQIFPERFANGDPTNDPKNTLPWGARKHPRHDDFYGGDLQGVIDHLDYLEDLGITGIYLTPIFKADTNHKYDTNDYMTIDPAFGNPKILKKLVNEAHARGIRVMLDAVFNHIGYTSKQWQDVLANQEDSIYSDWFYIQEFPVKAFEAVDYSSGEQFDRHQLTYQTFAFEPHMPKLNTSNPQVKDYLLGVARHYIQTYDIDGWRLDVANEVDHQFWKDFHRTCINLKADFYIVGEIWHSAQRFLEGDEFHAIMNYPMTDQIKDFFFGPVIQDHTIENAMTNHQFIDRISSQQMLYREQTNQVQFNLLDSHDTERIMTRAKYDRDKVQSALVFMFLQTGTPCIYYGTEIALDGGDDPDNRKCMVWEKDKQDLEMLKFTKKLIKMRQNYRDLIHFASLDWVHDLPSNRILAFKKVYHGQTLRAYFNQGSQDLKIAVNKNTKIVLTNIAEIECGDIYMRPGTYLVSVD
ncbi:glycoside hydrolase family 13 protein [Aerococcus urinaeequi]|uniref:Alpha-amylase n=1 Tax=Aerococcus viridans TaxID=1377 RepID=A0A2N6UCF6_9LACT|nr:glycoside hydrolase family 13 protein [Aerococcus viridans]PMC79258.1 alpha-glycosidase [Aerococcus viridans]